MRQVQEHGAARARAPLPDETDPGVQGLPRRFKIAPATFNDFRRTFASLLVQAGAANSLVAKMLGHTTTIMVDRVYGKQTVASLRSLIAQQTAEGARRQRRPARAKASDARAPRRRARGRRNAAKRAAKRRRREGLMCVANCVARRPFRMGGMGRQDRKTPRRNSGYVVEPNGTRTRDLRIKKVRSSTN